MTAYQQIAADAPSPDVTAEEAVQLFGLPVSHPELSILLKILPGIHDTGRRRLPAKGRPAFTYNVDQLARLFTALSEWLDA